MCTVLSKCTSASSELIACHLLILKCIPILLYACEALYLSMHDISVLDKLIFRAFAKIFHTLDHSIINDIRKIFDIMNIADSITKRQQRFYNRYFCKNFDFSNCIYDIFRIDSAQLFVP